jgi:hypothetical protein
MSDQEEFDLLVCDFDTALFRSAKFVEEEYLLVTNKVTEIVREFKNKTEFYGHWKKREGGWLSDTNKFMGVEVSPDDFSIEECVRLKPEMSDHLGQAMLNFDMAVSSAKGSVKAADYKLVIGGKENFRYKIAQELPYKGERKAKPLVFSDLAEKVKVKYSSKIIIAEGREADDVLSEMGFDNYKEFMKTKRWKYCLSYIDKDIQSVVSPMINPDKISEGVIFNTPREAARCYAIQLLTGDKSVDNIAGLPDLVETLREKYEVKKGKGLGKVTATKFLEGCSTPKELFERVVEAYKAYYGPRKKHKFVNFREEALEWTWKDFLSDRANLLWMYRDDTCKYNIFEDTLAKLKVEC